jgi:hypothetical protein
MVQNGVAASRGWTIAVMASTKVVPGSVSREPTRTPNRCAVATVTAACRITLDPLRAVPPGSFPAMTRTLRASASR